MSVYKYKLFSPGGNDTALVFGVETDIEKRRKIQDEIISKHPNVEQVGFISKSSSDPYLTMTGGEFCGNATRTAVWHYLNGSPGEITIRVSVSAEGDEKLLKAGVSEKTLEAWTSIPVDSDVTKVVMDKGDGLYWVQLDGISHLVVLQRRSDAIFREVGTFVDKEGLKAYANNLVRAYNLDTVDAYGVMFTENILDMIKIHPCVFIKNAGTSYYETACGSGTVAAGLVSSFLRGHGTDSSWLQPSGKFIHSSIEYQDGNIMGAKISGEVSSISNVLEG
jgi:diaminopimelate epimerase